VTISHSSCSGHKILWIAGVLPSVVFLIFCLILFIWIRRSKNKGKGKQDGHHSLMTTNTIKLWESEETGSQFTIFSFSQITNATNKFSTESKAWRRGVWPCVQGTMCFQSLQFTCLTISKTKIRMLIMKHVVMWSNFCMFWALTLVHAPIL